MLYRLELENFYSIREPQILDLRVPKGVSEYPERLAPIFPGSQERVAKAVALFGPNGSGKSTVLRALAFVAWFLRESFQHDGPGLPCAHFNDEDAAGRPIRLAIELGGPLDLSGANTAVKRWPAARGAGWQAGLPGPVESAGDVGTFRYELHLQSKNGALRTVSHEALRRKLGGHGKWQRVFERTADRSVLGSKAFPLSRFSQVVDKVREDASVIATLALFEHQASKVISKAAAAVFRNIVIDRNDPGDQSSIRYFAENPDALAALNCGFR